MHPFSLLSVLMCTLSTDFYTFVRRATSLGLCGSNSTRKPCTSPKVSHLVMCINGGSSCGLSAHYNAWTCEKVHFSKVRRCTSTHDMHIHTFNMHSHMHIHTPTHAHPDAVTHAHPHMHSHTHTCTSTHAFTHPHMHIHRCSHTCTSTHAHSHMHICTNMYAQHTCTCLSCIYTHHTPIQTCTHTHTHITHPHPHTDTHNSLR